MIHRCPDDAVLVMKPSDTRTVHVDGASNADRSADWCPIRNRERQCCQGQEDCCDGRNQLACVSMQGGSLHGGTSRDEGQTESIDLNQQSKTVDLGLVKYFFTVFGGKT